MYYSKHTLSFWLAPITLTFGALCWSQTPTTTPRIPSSTTPAFSELAHSQAQNNTEVGKRQIPAHAFAPPTQEVSAPMQALIAAPYPTYFNADPKNAQEWKTLIQERTQFALKTIPPLKEMLGVNVESSYMGGVHVYVVTPNNMPDKNKNRLLMHLHGGGYVFGPGEAGLSEAMYVASFGGYTVISVDYRMPPDHPYPAAMDDATAVWKSLVTQHTPKNMAVFGTSTGGAMTLALVLRAKDEHLPLPGAIAPSTPWSDLDKIGDSYQTNEWVDNILVSWDGWLGKAAKLYANGHDFKDPQLSPIYGDFHGFPPTILTSGTRDLFLSNTVRTHRKLKRAGVTAELNVYEGISHAQFGFSPKADETREVFSEIGLFFDRYLGQN